VKQLGPEGAGPRTGIFVGGVVKILCHRGKDSTAAFLDVAEMLMGRLQGGSSRLVADAEAVAIDRGDRNMIWVAAQ
jgi:ATP-dependent DNA ligase